MSATHTPGPWDLIHTDDPYEYLISGPSEWSENCIVVRVDRRNDAHEAFANRAEADARLIAAAPDLIAALKLALCYVENPGSPASRRNGDISTIRAAIAKAVQS